MTPPVLILQTGQPVASMRRHGGFPHWIRVAAGLSPDEAVVVDVAGGAPLPRRDGFGAAIITGSAAMVTDRADWSEATADWLREAVPAGLPVLGICYGHQLLAHALGGVVQDHPDGREMGTVEVSLLADAAHDPLFGGLPATFAAQATHVQTVSRVPHGATVLARSVHDACHAFRVGDAAWGVQFHPEFSATHMRGYVRARRGALHAEGTCPETLVGQIRATPQARRVLRRFVHHVTGGVR